MKINLREYTTKNEYLFEWLPWEALIYPAVILNKDGSYICAFKYNYKELTENTDNRYKDIEYLLNTFTSGWTIWIDKFNNDLQKDKYISITWNPEKNKQNKICNTLNILKKAFYKQDDIFLATVSKIKDILSCVFDVTVLENEELLQYLSDTLVMGNKISMPDIPIHLDGILSSENTYDKKDGGIIFNQNKFAKIVSIKGCPDNLAPLFKALENIEYRFNRRYMFFSYKDQIKEENRYMKNWCKSRKFIKDLFISNNINRCGYYQNIFIIYGDSNEMLEKHLSALYKKIQAEGYVYVEENRNMGDVWLSTLPGLFRANLNPPFIQLEKIAGLFLI